MTSHLQTSPIYQSTVRKYSHISPTVLLDPKNVGVAVGISLLSRIQAEIYAIPYVLPVYDSHV